MNNVDIDKLCRTHKLVRDKIPSLSTVAPDSFVQIPMAKIGTFIGLKLFEEIDEMTYSAIKFAEKKDMEHMDKYVEEVADVYTVLQALIRFIEDIKPNHFWSVFNRKMIEKGGFEEGWLMSYESIKKYKESKNEGK